MQKFVGSDLSFADTGSPGGDLQERSRIEAMARRLYILAWVIEGVAVSLGLGMALSLNYAGETSFADFVLGGGGFVMVACAELSKIPLATFLVETPGRRSKVVTLTFLALMSFITFETIFMSLERGFDARMRAVNTLKEQLTQLQAHFAKLTSVIDNPGADLLSTRAAIERELADTDKALKTELDAIREERANLWQQQRASGLPKEIDDQRQMIDTRRKRLAEERDSKVAAAHARARDLIALRHRELNAARSAGDSQRVLEVQRHIAQLNSGAERLRIERDYQRSLEQSDAEERKLVDQRAQLTFEGEAAIKPRLDELARKEVSLNLEYSAKRDALRKRLNNIGSEEKEALGKVTVLIRDRDEHAKLADIKQDELRKAAAASQLHRLAPPLAGWWTDRDYEPHTIPDVYVRALAVIWFGSMAALGAIGGSVVAMVSQLLWKRANNFGAAEQAPVPTPEQNSKRWKLSTTLRRMLLSWRFFRVKTRTVEVVKTETKTVTKIVAVPVPVAVNGSHEDFGRLKNEYEALAGPLSER